VVASAVLPRQRNVSCFVIQVVNQGSEFRQYIQEVSQIAMTTQKSKRTDSKPNLARAIDNYYSVLQPEKFRVTPTQASREQLAAPDWIEVMLEGQLTRDPVLRTAGERREARRRNNALDAERRKVSGCSESGRGKPLDSVSSADA